MGYVLFAHQQQVTGGLINSKNLALAQISDQRMVLASHTSTLQSQITSLTSRKADQTGDLYQQMTSADDSSARETVQAEIEKLETDFEAEIAKINLKIYNTSIKDQALEMQQKKEETILTALQKTLDNIEAALKNAIDKGAAKVQGLSN